MFKNDNKYEWFNNTISTILDSECSSPVKRNSPRATNNDHIYKIKVAGYFKFSYYKAYWHKNKLL